MLQGSTNCFQVNKYSSDAFSLSGNVQDGDSRTGLDVASKKEVLKIMKSQKVNFDEARQLFMVQKLAKNGIAPDGRPMGKLFFPNLPKNPPDMNDY